jgi:hypothetical protein
VDLGSCCAGKCAKVFMAGWKSYARCPLCFEKAFILLSGALQRSLIVK